MVVGLALAFDYFVSQIEVVHTWNAEVLCQETNQFVV